MDGTGFDSRKGEQIFVFFAQKCTDRYWTHPALYSKRTGASSSGVKETGV